MVGLASCSNWCFVRPSTRVKKGSTWLGGVFTNLAEASVIFSHTNFVEQLKAGGRDSHSWGSTDWRDADCCYKSLVEKFANYRAFKVCLALFITGRFKVFLRSTVSKNNKNIMRYKIWIGNEVKCLCLCLWLYNDGLNIFDGTDFTYSSEPMYARQIKTTKTKTKK